MAGARAKPKCDIVGGKRLPDLKSLQAGKSKRRKLQERRKSCNQKTLHLETAHSKTAMGLFSCRWAGEEVQAPGGLNQQDPDSGSERSLSHTRALERKQMSPWLGHSTVGWCQHREL